MKDTVLIIEDNLEMCENIADILKLGNYEVLTANNGKEGVKLALAHKPDLILCDIMMPELDGYGVLHVLGKYLTTSDTPFIFLTAKSEKEDFRKGMGLGADDYLIKPFDGMELLETVEMRLKRNRQLKTAFENEPKDLGEFFEKTKELKGFENLSGNKLVKQFKKKDFIFREGQAAGSLFYLIEGEIKTNRYNEDGKEFITGIFTSGQYLGYVSLLKNIPYSENAVALTDVTLETILKEDFQTLVHTNRLVASQFMKILSNNILEAEKRLFELAYQSVRQRVASTILTLHERDLSQNKDEGLISMLRRDMAGIVGTALETLNRTLSDFREEGLIKIEHGGVRIVDKKGLVKVSK
ncbi:response regulator [Algoriphagus persicinus]|uniref:response regulator n=1 Tax=Algoriphagus persicinus TaxID=3108754 RepID=UPI002B3DD633|nr:response regulator [Algoriphagus sp. E1-3-M2]MEB2785252.1 response regulator [Algoriphagus sp. E1-3-M2]